MDIRIAGDVTQAAFRDLVIEHIPRLCSEDARIEPAPALDSDHTLLVRCGDQGQVLLAFDVEDPNRALMQGLLALDQLSPAPPAGNSLLSRLRGFQWRPCKVLDVDGRLGLLVAPPEAVRDEPARLRPAPRDEQGNALSPEEAAFFDHL